MSRYIDADKLRHMILYFADAKNLDGNHEQAKTYNHCLIMIDESKTADVVEVVHGKWIHKGEEVYCSECKFRFYPVMFKYCPGCGAKMEVIK